MKRIAIIPARGGSKRIPRKNIKDFLGKPIIAYSIEAAIKSHIYDEIMVSTDDMEIAEVAKKYGANVPFLRSAQASNDFATTADVLLEVLDNYSKHGQEFDIVSCIYCTAPFVTSERLIEASELMKDGVDSVTPVVSFSYPVLRSVRINNGQMRLAYPEYQNSRSQDLETYYHDAGQFYFMTSESLKKNKFLWGTNAVPLILSELEVQDLDTLTDWKLAEMKYELLNTK